MEIENSIVVVAGTEIPAVSPVDPRGRPGRRCNRRPRLYLDYGRLMADKCPSLPVLGRTRFSHGGR